MHEPPLLRLAPWNWPQALRLAAYALAVAILLYLCLAPEHDLPHVNLWDKAEHATAWFVLAATGLLLWPSRPRAVAVFAIALGGLVEVLQATMGFGRDGDWRDWAADGIGVAAALTAWVLTARLAARRPAAA